MANEQLIARLADDLQPVRRRRAGRDIGAIAALCLAELAAFLAFGPTRADMPMAMDMPSFWWKFVSLGVIALAGGAIAILSFEPTRSPRRGLRGAAALVGASLAALWLIDALRGGWPDLASRLNWQDGLQCVLKMVVLSAPPLIGLGLLMRRGAPTDRAGTSLAVGVASASWGAFVFLFACPYDDPIYIALWYAVGCSLVTVSARFGLPLVTRW